MRMVLKFITVLIYDVIMGISTSYPSMHCTLDITECGTSCVCAENDLLNYTAIIYCIVLLYYEGNSVSKLQIQVATYVFELSAGNCHR